MEVKNVNYFSNQAFSDYLAVPGTSFSSLKEFKGKPGLGMMLGTRVHNFLNEPAEYDWIDCEIVLPIADAIRKTLGASYDLLKSQGATRPYLK